MLAARFIVSVVYAKEIFQRESKVAGYFLNFFCVYKLAMRPLRLLRY